MKDSSPLTAVVAAKKLRSRVAKFTLQPKVAPWWLWLECGHTTKRLSSCVPHKVRCLNCKIEHELSIRHTRNWYKGEIPKDFGVIRVRKPVTRNAGVIHGMHSRVRKGKGK